MAANQRQSLTKADNAVLTVEQWEAKGKEALGLTCNALDISSVGSVEVLAQRLYDHYHKPPPSPSPPSPSVLNVRGRRLSESSSSGTDTDTGILSSDSDNYGDRNKFDSERNSPVNLADERQKQRRAEGDPEIDFNKNPKNQDQGNNQNENEQSTFEFTEEDALPVPQDHKETNNEAIMHAQAALQAAEANGALLQDLLTRIGDLTSGQALQAAEVKVIRSQLKKTATSSANPPKSATSAPPPTPKAAASQTANKSKHRKTTATNSKPSKPTTAPNLSKTKKSAKKSPEKPRRKSPTRHRNRSRSPHDKNAYHSPPPVPKPSPVKKRSSSRKTSRSSRLHRKAPSPERTSPDSTGKVSSSSSSRGSRYRSSRSTSPASPTLPSVAISLNHYTPAPISRRCVELIEKGEFVEFEKLRPKSVDQKTREDNNNNVQMRFSSKSQTYTLERSKRDTIETFSRWMEAWNAFVQTRLHFKPQEAFSLFTYQNSSPRYAPNTNLRRYILMI